MKIVDTDWPEYDTVALSKLKAEYVQNLDCAQSEKMYPEGCQVLTLETDDGGGGKFIRIKTDNSGWSIDNIDDFVELLKDFKQRYSCE